MHSPFFNSYSASYELASQDKEHDNAYQNPDGQDIGDGVERGWGRRDEQEDEDNPHDNRPEYRRDDVTQDVEPRTTLAPEEENTGDTDQGVHEHDEEGVERSPEAEGNERHHGEACNKTDHQP